MIRISVHQCLLALGISALIGCGTSKADGDRAAVAAQTRPIEQTAAAPSTVVDSSDGTVVSAAPVDSDITKADVGRVQGNPKAKVWLVMTSDFECPYCKEWHDATYQQVVRDYVKTGKVRLAYVNFPLVTIHPNAMAAAEAAMCASAQGRFWEMHDALFATQKSWAPLPKPDAFFDSLATRLVVNLPKWRQCTSGKVMKGLIDADEDRSSKSGVTSTPSFFVGNQLLVGVRPYSDFRTVLEAELAKSAPAGGAPPTPPTR